MEPLKIQFLLEARLEPIWFSQHETADDLHYHSTTTTLHELSLKTYHTHTSHVRIIRSCDILPKQGQLASQGTRWACLHCPWPAIGPSQYTTVAAGPHRPPTLCQPTTAGHANLRRKRTMSFTPTPKVNRLISYNYLSTCNELFSACTCSSTRQWESPGCLALKTRGTLTS